MPFTVSAHAIIITNMVSFSVPRSSSSYVGTHFPATIITIILSSLAFCSSSLPLLLVTLFYLLSFSFLLLANRFLLVDSYLSTLAWSRHFFPIIDGPDLQSLLVSVNGFIYLLGYGDVGLDRGIRSNLIVSFDLKSETLGQVHLPDILLHTQYLGLSKRNECLTVLENSQTGIGVWMMKDGVTKSFTKMFALKSCSPLSCMGVLEFRKNGKAIIVTIDNVFDEDIRSVARLQVYDPCSGDFNDIGFGEINGPFSVSSYMETLLLLDQSDSISH
ncbi:reverse transcriptase domain-containing protein [Tanacetum coccineum]